MKNNAFRFNPFHRNTKFPTFVSNPNAELPESQPLCLNMDFHCPSNGKPWDDSEISDFEMDRELELMNMKGMTLF